MLAKLSGMDEKEIVALDRELVDLTGDKPFIPSPGPQSVAYFSLADILLYGGCVSGDTEFLSQTGWKRIDEYEYGDRVSQWDEKTGSLTSALPVGYTKDACSELIKFSGGRVSMVLSPNHRMPLYQWDGKFVVKDASKVADRPSKHKVPVNFKVREKIGIDCSDVMLRLMVAINAGGSIERIRDGGGARCRIALRKQRKIDRLLGYLDELGIEYHTYSNPNRPTEFRYSFESPVTTKRYEGFWWNANQFQLEIILDEMSYWDGHIAGTQGGDIVFNSIHRCDADFIQYAAHACGRVAMIAKREARENHSEIYRVAISHEGSVKGSVTIRSDLTKTEMVSADYQYCFKVLTSFWLARHDGKVFITGNSPGGGKTGLLIGLAANEFNRSLIVRKQFTDLEGVMDNAKGLLDDDAGFVGGMRPKYRKPDGGVIGFEGMPKGGGIDTGKQGNAREFIGIDEGAQLSENQVRALFGWLRPLKSGQGKKCRMILASNPPLDPIGDWMIEAWGPWLNPSHPNPAEEGELRWFIYNADDKSQEVDGPESVTIEGKTFTPHSRTFIRSTVDDNPYLDSAEYKRSIEIMPEPYRTILQEGNFMYARADQAFQVIPTQWIREAQARWTDTPYPGIPMCAIGVDVACGGSDNTVLACRYDGWFAPLVVVPGVNTPKGTDVAGLVISERRDNAEVIIDMGGGYGGAPLEHLENNIGERFVHGHVAQKKSTDRTKEANLQFVNCRSAMWWKFREALDPSQAGGSMIALPDDTILVADLSAPTFEMTSGGKIKVESKMDGVDANGNPKPGIAKRLGRSPDRGDAVVMAWSEGNRAMQTHLTHQAPQHRVGSQMPRNRKTINDPYHNRRRR